ncbi:GntP family permease [Jannaschia donghaensis]|uniref:H+/gluconate symporter n=1 Tax=Jannaschia donghaensis TaxID=420998 RepID=A0A0M6YKU3_9RHOB|nr:GntP family permease [Jannaschia donghaensis]CTQ50514.1 H+/gluconate symporter [Jannaschia donghaensis]
MLGILLSLGLLILLAYRGVSVIVLAPVLAVLAVVLNEGGPVLGTYTQVFLPAMGGYVVRFFPLFLLGAIFGTLMQATGSAEAIARWIVARLGAGRSALSVVVACAVLTYGGVSLFVVAFAVYPIAASLFAAAGQPKRLIPATIALGAFTFTMTAVPGSPQIQNAIPAPYFGTDSFAAPVSGLVAAVIMAGFGMWWLTHRLRQAAAAGEDYGEADDFAGGSRGTEDLPAVWIAAAPIVLVIAVNLVASRVILPALDTAYLAEVGYGATTLDAVRGTWALIVALTLAILACIGVNLRRLEDLNETVKAGVAASFLPIFNTASEVGYGTVIASLAAFALLRDALVQIAPGNPLISEAVAVNILAGVTGSASGGMSIALEALGETYLAMAMEVGISPEMLHRVAALASGGFDVLPHNGAVITLLAITGLTHTKSYFDIFMVAVIGPLLGLAAVLALSFVQ